MFSLILAFWCIICIAYDISAEFWGFPNFLWTNNVYHYSSWFNSIFLWIKRDFRPIEIGASTDPCSHYYAGPTPFSEIETKSLSEFVKTFDVKIYLSLHSFGQFVVFPKVTNRDSHSQKISE